MTDCLAATRCRGFNRDTQQPAAAGTTPLCEPCLTSAGQAVPMLIHDFRDLEQLIPKPVGVSLDEYHTFQKRSGPPVEAPTPIRLDVEALQAEIWWLATVWAEVLTDVQKLADPPVHVRQGHAVQWAVQLLTPRTETLAKLGEVEMVTYPRADPETAIRHGAAEISYITGAQGLLDLSRSHQRARSVLGLTDPIYVLPGRCQSRSCGRAELRVKDGSDTVWCDHCGAAMTRDDYDRMGNLFLREAA